MKRLRTTPAVALGSLAAILALAGISRTVSARAYAQQVRDVAVTGNQFAFSPNVIEVQKDDLVKVTFTASDMPHSFTIERYRISKRAGAGQSVTFEFRADQPGEHEFYCNLSQDERCRNMKGRLVVR